MNYTLPLKSVGINDIPLVGGKNASLGEMLQHLTALGVSIPDGFVITVDAYYEFIKYNQLNEKIKDIPDMDFIIARVCIKCISKQVTKKSRQAFNLV